MAIANYYMIYVKRNSEVTYDQLEDKMNLANDWYRIEEDLWIVYSTSDPEKWYSRLSPIVKDAGRVFICKLDISKRQGWMDSSFWKWLRREWNLTTVSMRTWPLFAGSKFGRKKKFPVLITLSANKAKPVIPQTVIPLKYL